MFNKSVPTKNKSIFGRLIRSLLSIIVLSAFVLFISLFVKELASLDVARVASVLSKVLAKANINVDESQIGDVAGVFMSRVNDTDLSNVLPVDDLNSTSSVSSDSVVSTDADVSTDTDVQNATTFNVAILSDIHGDTVNLEKALNLMNQHDVDMFIVLGDLTDFGTLEDLKKIKSIFDSSSMEYYVLPGDHDLAETSDVSNFISVFDSNYYFVDKNNIKFLLLDNSANFTMIPKSTLLWFNDLLPQADFVFFSQPLFVDGLYNPFDMMYMGSTREIPSSNLIELQKDVLAQRDDLLSVLRDSTNVKHIFAGDHHKSSNLVDTSRKDLTHNVVGAVTGLAYEGLPQRLIQSSRFTLLKIYSDTKDVEISEIVIE